MPPLTLKYIKTFTPRDFEASRVWSGCCDRADDLWEMAEDGYSEAEIAAAIQSFINAWPDEDHYFPISESGVERQHRTRGLLFAALIHTPDGESLPGFVSSDADIEVPTAFLNGRAYDLDLRGDRGVTAYREFMSAIGAFARLPLVIENLVTGRRWSLALR